MCVCECVCTSGYGKLFTSPIAFQFVYMALAIDVTNGSDLSNEARCELLLKRAR